MKSIADKAEGKIIILNMICFEYLILAFDKLVAWTGTGKTDKIKIREEVLSAIEDHRINLSKIDDVKTLQYLAGFKRYSKKLSWIDINNETKKCYYKKIILNQNKIRNDEITVEQFAEFLPTVSVEVNIQASGAEEYYVKDMSYAIEDGEIQYGIKYEFAPKNCADIFRVVKEVVSQTEINDANLKESGAFRLLNDMESLEMDDALVNDYLADLCEGKVNNWLIDYVDELYEEMEDIKKRKERKELLALIGNRSVLFDFDDFEDDENESYHRNMFESDDIEGGENL